LLELQQLGVNLSDIDGDDEGKSLVEIANMSGNFEIAQLLLVSSSSSSSGEKKIELPTSPVKTDEEKETTSTTSKLLANMLEQEISPSSTDDISLNSDGSNASPVNNNNQSVHIARFVVRIV